jgi:hypothetical protein
VQWYPTYLLRACQSMITCAVIICALLPQINRLQRQQPVPYTHLTIGLIAWPGKSRCTNDLVKSVMHLDPRHGAAPEDAGEDTDQVGCLDGGNQRCLAGSDC